MTVFDARRTPGRPDWSRRFARVLGFTLLFSLTLAGAAAADSPTLTAAKACRKAITAKGKTYANKRRSLLLACAGKLLKCQLALEVEGTNPATCLSTAITACTSKLGTLPTSSLSTAQTKFHDTTVTACLPFSFAAIMSNAAGGLWFGNDATCSASADLPTLITCLRTEIDVKVDQVVGRVNPRAGLLLDNIGLGSNFPNLPRPPTSAVVISATAPGSGTLVNPGTISVSNGTSVTFSGDSSTLPCGGGPGNNGKVTITVGAGISCPPAGNSTASQLVLHAPYGPSDTATFGPFDVNVNYCIELKDGGGPGGCNDKTSGLIAYTPGGATPPSSASAALRACDTRFKTKVKAFAGFDATKLHGCAEKIVRCKLAFEIDAVDPSSCLASAGTACSGIPVKIDNSLALAKTKIPLKCGLIPFSDLQPFVGGLGFSNVAAGCSGQADLTALMDCVLGKPTTAADMSGTKCSVEHKVFIRDPRAKDSLSDAHTTLNPTTQFPCLGP
jgi:hypothetical protein